VSNKVISIEPRPPVGKTNALLLNVLLRSRAEVDDALAQAVEYSDRRKHLSDWSPMEDENFVRLLEAHQATQDRHRKLLAQISASFVLLPRDFYVKDGT
jgi:hypothetical protein